MRPARGGAPAPSARAGRRCRRSRGRRSHSAWRGGAARRRVPCPPRVQLEFQIDQLLHLGQEPGIDAGELRPLLHHQPAAEGLRDDEQALVRRLSQTSSISIGPLPACLERKPKCRPPANAGPSSAPLRGALDGHDLAGGLHLRTDAAVGGANLSKGHAGSSRRVIQRRLEQASVFCVTALGSRPGVAPPRFRRHARDRIAGSLGGERAGAADAGVDLDHDVVVALVSSRTARCTHPRYRGRDDLEEADRSIWYSWSRGLGGAATMESPVCTPMDRSSPWSRW